MSTGLTKEEYYDFVKNALVGDVVLGGRCTNNCIFCCTKSSEKAIGRRDFANYISREDLESVIGLIGRLVREDKQIAFGGGSYLQTCEPFQHPQYLELLKCIHSHYPNHTKFSATIGKNIDPVIYDDLKKMNVSFYVSINSFDKETRSRVMKSKEDYEGLLRFLKECSSIIYKASFIHFGDVDVLKKDIEMLYSIDSDYENKRMKLWLPYCTQYSSDEAKKLYFEAHKTYYEANRILHKYNKQPHPTIHNLSEYPRDFESPEWSSLAKNFDGRVARAKAQLNQQGVKLEDVGFLIPESCWKYSEKYQSTINRIFVKNITFGGSYTVGGIISKKDILHAVKSNPAYKHYTLPREMSDDYKCDLAGHRLTSYGLSLFMV